MSMKSVWAVVAGVLFIIVVTTVVDVVLHAIHVAPRNPMKHALILGVVGTALGLVGVAATWNLGLGPRWYAIGLAVLATPQCWLGGKIHEMLSAKSVGGTP